MIEPEVPHNSAQENPAPVFYDGRWERKGISPVVSAFVVLFGIGALYFTASNILSIPIGIYAGFSGEIISEDLSFWEKMSAVFSLLALPIQILLVVAQYGFLLIPVLILTRKLHTERVRDYLRFRRAPLGEIILAVAVTIAMIPLTNWLANEITRWFGIPEWFANLGIELFTAHSLPEFIWLVFVIGITPAICEETLFRGYAQRTLERKLGAKSIWIVGVIFGLYHFNPLGLVSLAMMGVVFGFYFYRSKSLLPSMAAHFTNNFIVVYMLYSRITIGGVDLATMQSIPLWFVGLSTAMGAILLYVYFLVTKGRTDPFPNEEPVIEGATTVSLDPVL